MLFINKKKVVGNEYPEVPITLEQVMKDNPNTSIPRLSIANKLLKVEDVMESLGYEACYSEPIDVLKDLIGDSFKGKKLVLVSATKKDGKWIRNYKEEAILDADLAHFQTQLRKRRNAMLRYSDWSQIDDLPISAEKKEEWKVYRQKLRDLPDKYDHPIWCNFPAWPGDPELGPSHYRMYV